MPSLTASFDTGRTYQLLGVIQGTVTTGVTLAPTGGKRPGQTENVTRLIIKSDDANGGNKLAYGDAGIATDGSTGRVMVAGDVDMFQGPPCPTLLMYLSVSVSGTKADLYWD